MPADPNCVFCKIVAGTIPAHIVHRCEHTLAFLDVNPLAEGHLLIIPRDHYADLSELPDEAAAAIGAQLPRLARAVLTATGAEGVNTLANQGKAAGQVVPHVHFHLIPRRTGDGLGYRWNAGTYDPGRDVEMATQIKAALA